MKKWMKKMSFMLLMSIVLINLRVPPVFANTNQNQTTPITPNLSNAPYQMVNGYKTFHLTAEPVTREVSKGIFMKAWGYNGTTPGPTIVVRNGDKVSIQVTHHLQVPTSVHWHGLIIPNKMDGVPNLEPSPVIQPGQSFTYHFTVHQVGTFMYHSHYNGSKQEMMGLEGMFISLPKNGDRVDGIQVQDDYTLMTQEFELLTPNQTSNNAQNQNPTNKTQPYNNNTNNPEIPVNPSQNSQTFLLQKPFQASFPNSLVRSLKPINWCMFNQNPSSQQNNSSNSFNANPNNPSNPSLSSASGNQSSQPFGAGQVPPGQYVVNAKAMQWNMFTFNGKQFPATAPMIINQGDWVSLVFLRTYPDWI